LTGTDRSLIVIGKKRKIMNQEPPPPDILPPGFQAWLRQASLRHIEALLMSLAEELEARGVHLRYTMAPVASSGRRNEEED